MRGRGFLAEEWINKDIDICRVSDKMIVVNIFVQDITVSVFAVYASLCGLDDHQKDIWVLWVATNFQENEIIAKAKDLSGHAWLR